MTREEILEKSRSENQNKDYADLETQSKAALVAYYAGFVFCSNALNGFPCKIYSAAKKT